MICRSCRCLRAVHAVISAVPLVTDGLYPSFGVMRGNHAYAAALIARLVQVSLPSKSSPTQRAASCVVSRSRPSVLRTLLPFNYIPFFPRVFISARRLELQTTMSRLVYLLFSLPLLLSFITSAHAGPACARRNQGTDSCIEACKQKWGWPGFVMGTDPWGSVMTVTKTNDMGAVITQACRARSYVVLTYSLPCLSNSLSFCPVSQVCSWCLGLCYTYRIQHKYPLVYADSARHLDYRFPFPRPRQCDSICIRVYCHICSRFGRTFCILGAFRLEQHLI